MTDLERALAHAQTMAGAEHRPDCPPRDRRPRWINEHDADGWITGGHEEQPRCPGCVTDTERALWRQLADEYAAQVERGREETLL